MDDFFAELNAEIAKHTDSAARKAAAAKAKAKSNDRRLSQEARSAADQEWRELQRQIEADQWRDVSTIALFTEQTCDGCGSIHRVFLQYMVEQHHVRPAKGRRTLRVLQPDMSLPLATLIQSHKTHMCADCCEDHGFAIHGAMFLSLAGESQINVSSSYSAADINSLTTETEA